MAINKYIKGKTDLFKCWEYLKYNKVTKKERTLATDIFNIQESQFIKDYQEKPKPWYKVMDETREKYNTNSSSCVNKGQKINKYFHFVLSPDPKDYVSLNQLQDFVKEWVDKCFQTQENSGKCQVAVEYHNDNGIMHAHIIVNNVNLDIDKSNTEQRQKGETRFISSWLSINRMKKILAYRELMCEERGWHNFLSRQEEQLVETTPITKEQAREILKEERKKLSAPWFMDPDVKYKPPTQIHSNGDYLFNRKGSYYDRKESEIIAKTGTSQKEEIRKYIYIAQSMSRNATDFVKIINCFGVEIKNSADGEWKYSHPDKPQLFYTGKRLGPDFKKQTILYNFKNSTPKTNHLPKLKKSKNGLFLTSDLKRKDKWGMILALGNCCGLVWIGDLSKKQDKIQGLPHNVISKDRIKCYETLDKYNLNSEEEIIQARDNAKTKGELLELNHALTTWHNIWANSDYVQTLNLTSLRPNQKITDLKISTYDLTQEEVLELARKIYKEKKYDQAARKPLANNGRTRRPSVQQPKQPTERQQQPQRQTQQYSR